MLRDGDRKEHHVAVQTGLSAAARGVATQQLTTAIVIAAISVRCRASSEPYSSLWCYGPECADCRRRPDYSRSLMVFRPASYSTPGSIPPSHSMVVPLTKSASPLARNTQTRPTSAGSPARRNGTAAKYFSPAGSSLGRTKERKFSVIVGRSEERRVGKGAE